MKIKKFLGLASVALLSICACQDPDYMRYDSAYTGIYFTRDTLQYSFSVTPVEIQKHVLKVPVRIMGAPSSEEREFEFELIPDSCNAEAGVQYNIGKTVIEADSIQGYIPVEILRDGLEGDYANGYVHYQLAFRLVSNEHFIPTLSEKEQIRVVKFDNAVEQPNWLSASGEKVWYVDVLGTWHPFTFIKMVEYFHALEEIMPETYQDMVDVYGENLEHIPYGDPWQYRTIFKKHIYAPIYEYTNNPDNHDAIVAMYPDYPFDFPNPFPNASAEK